MILVAGVEGSIAQEARRQVRRRESRSLAGTPQATPVAE